MLRGSFRNHQRSHALHVGCAIPHGLTLQLPEPSRLFAKILSGLLISAATVVHTSLEGLLLKCFSCLFGVLKGLLEQCINLSVRLADGVKAAVWVICGPLAGGSLPTILASYPTPQGLRPEKLNPCALCLPLHPFGASCI